MQIRNLITVTSQRASRRGPIGVAFAIRHAGDGRQEEIAAPLSGDYPHPEVGAVIGTLVALQAADPAHPTTLTTTSRAAAFAIREAMGEPVAPWSPRPDTPVAMIEARSEVMKEAKSFREGVKVRLVEAPHKVEEITRLDALAAKAAEAHLRDRLVAAGFPQLVTQRAEEPTVWAEEAPPQAQAEEPAAEREEAA